MSRGSFNPPDDDDEDDAEAFLTRINDMLAGGDADWASETLEGIAETVERTGVVTPGQRTAIENIEDAITRKARRTRW